MRRLLLFLLLAGLLARVLYLGQVADQPFFQDPVGDSARYLERSREILDGSLAGDRPFFYGGIFYPYLLAAVLLVSGGNLYPICLAQALAGCALAVVLYRLGAVMARPGGRARGETIGVLAAAMALFYGPMAFLEADILMVSWTLLAVMLAALLCMRSLRPGGPAAAVWPLLLAGLLAGLAASERPNLVALLPALAVWAGWNLPRRSMLAGPAALLAGGGIVLACVAGLNHAASGRWVLLTTSSGINFYIGNHEGARGTFDEPWAAGEPQFNARYTDLEEASLVMARRLGGERLGPVEASRFWLGRGVRFLRERPAEAARLYLRKALLFWSAVEVPNHLDYAFMRGAAPWLNLMPLGFWLVGPLGLYGLLSPAARRILAPPAAALLTILVLVPMITVLPFFVADRYRILAVPPLMVASACGLIDLARRLADPLLRRGGSIRAICLALAALASVRMGEGLAEFDAARSHWMQAQAYKKHGDLAAAVRHYELALGESPGAPLEALLRNNLGVALGQMGEGARAEEQYRKAIELAPALAFPHKNLGLLLLRTGRHEEAFARLREAEKQEPDDLEIARALAAMFLARGEPVEAIRRARAVLASFPDDPTASAVLQAAGAPR